MDARSPGRVRTLPAGSGQASESSELRTGERARLEPPVPGSDEKAPRKGRPSGTRPIVTGTMRPVLASECLRDDFAPLEPWKTSGARAYAAMGGAVAIASGATMMRGGSMLGAAIGVGAGVVVAASLATSRYAARAAIALVGALLVVGAGFAKLGPLAAWGADSHALRWSAAVLLAATLFLRGTYRAHRPILVPLTLGVVTYLASASLAGGHLVWLSNAPLSGRIVAGGMAVIAALSLLAFMGAETTAGCIVWGVAALLGTAASFGLEATDLPTIVAGVVASLAAAVAATAIFQLASAPIGPRARALSRLSVPQPPPDDEPPSEAS